MNSSIVSGIIILLACLGLAFYRRKQIPMGRSSMVQVVPNSVLAEVGRRVIAKQPSTIQLVRQPGWVWSNPSAVAQMSKEIEAQGFHDSSTCTVKELPDVAVKFFLNQEERGYFAIYEHKKAGSWLNLIYLFEDGTSLTISSTKNKGLKRNPMHALIHVPDGSAQTLSEEAKKFLQEHDKARKLLSDESILHEFEEAWAQEIKWRESNPITAQEVLAVAQTRDVQKTKPLVIDFLGEIQGKSEQELKVALGHFFSQNRLVERAYLTKARHEGCDVPVVALCVAVGKGEKFDLLQEIRTLISASPKPIDMILDVLTVDERQEERLKSVCSPFYEKNAATELH